MYVQILEFLYVFEVDGFDWDEGNWPKCAKHGLTKTEIEETFLYSPPMVQTDRTSQDKEVRYNAIGKTFSGRMVFLVFTIRDKNGRRLLRPISARYMPRKEVEHYERQRRQTD